MDKISDDKFAELEQQYSEIVCVTTRLGEAAFRAPKRSEYDRYLSFLFDEKKRSKAQEILVRACRIHPSAEQFEAWVEKAPGIVVTCSGPVLELGGQAGEPEIRKSARADS